MVHWVDSIVPRRFSICSGLISMTRPDVDYTFCTFVLTRSLIRYPHRFCFAPAFTNSTVHCTAVCLDPVRTSDAELPPPVSDELKHTDQIATVTRATSSSRGIGGAAEAEINKLRTETEAADFANYFSSYAELDHQKQMLEDERYVPVYFCVCVCVQLCWIPVKVFDVRVGKPEIVETLYSVVTAARCQGLTARVSICSQAYFLP